MECVSTVTYSLLMNGGLTKPFQAKKGLRQGNPMSPYLFLIAMEYLQREMAQLASNKVFHFHPRCKKLGVVHVCFTDDFLMFCWAKNTFVTLLQTTFTRFSNASGL